MIKLHIFHEDQVVFLTKCFFFFFFGGGGVVFILQFLISGKKCQLRKISYKTVKARQALKLIQVAENSLLDYQN